MLRKMIFSALLAVCSFALMAANEFKTFKLAQEMCAVKAGTAVNTEVEFEAQDGYVLAGWNCTLIRKNAAPEFFALEGLKIRKHATHKAYDTVDVVKYHHFPQAQKSGKFPVRINTAGMPVGSYALFIQGRWMKDGKSTYPGVMLYLEITDADNGKFAPSTQETPAAFKAPRAAAPTPKWCKKIAVTPNPVSVNANSKIAFNCDYEALDGEFYGGYVVLILRKGAPAAFFDNNQAKVKKHPTAPGYDSIILKPFTASANSKTAQIAFELDTTNYPAGDYDVLLQVRVVKANGKTAYPSYPLTVTLK